MACDTFQTSRLVESADIPTDFDSRLSIALSVIADDRATSILLGRYRDGETLQAIGDKVSISRQRIGQLVGKYIKRLRQPDILRYLNCNIENIPERTSRAVLVRLEDKKHKMQSDAIHDANHNTCN